MLLIDHPWEAESLEDTTENERVAFLQAGGIENDATPNDGGGHDEIIHVSEVTSKSYRQTTGSRAAWGDLCPG